MQEFTTNYNFKAFTLCFSAKAGAARRKTVSQEVESSEEEEEEEPAQFVSETETEDGECIMCKQISAFLFFWQLT